MNLIFIAYDSYSVMGCKSSEQTILHGTSVLKLINDNCFPRFLALLQHCKHNRARNFPKSYKNRNSL